MPKTSETGSTVPLITTIEIDRPPQAVFGYATDPARFPNWQKEVHRVQILDTERFLTVRRYAGAERTMTQRVVEREPPRRWAARGIEGPIRAHASITIEPLDDGQRSRVTFCLDFEGRGLGAPLIPLIRHQAERGAPRSYQRLKELLEHED